MREVLRFDGVWKGFDRHHAHVPVLDEVSLSVAEGEIVAVVAGAGQGKTTLIELASGTLPPDRGCVQVNGVDLTRLKDKDVARLLAGEIGVATRSGPAMNMSAREYVELALGAPKDGRRRRWNRREQSSMAAAILDELDIAECAELRWEALSDWQRVLVELAQAVCVSPRLLLVDDIAHSFGLRQKQVLMDVLVDLARERKCGVLMAVSDHAAALRSVRVWQLHRHRLRLMADHTEKDVDTADEAEVVPLERWSDAR
jgi:ABC-type cobalamin/Fe3+-siderophores transport system ATPase subunit